MNNTTFDYPIDNPVLRIFGAASYLAWCLVGIAINGLLLIVFIKGHKQFKTMSFFIISWQLLFVDLLALFIQLILIVPINFAGSQIYSQLFADIIAGMDTLTYYGFLIFAFVLTLNRFLVFLFPTANHKLFARPNIIWIISGIWILFGFFIIAWNLESYKTYRIEGYYLDYIDRLEFQNVTVLKFFASFQGHASNFVPPIILAMYAIIFVEIKFCFITMIRSRSFEFVVKTHNRKEINLLIQSGILCLALGAENLVWHIPGWFALEGDARTVAYIILNWIMIFMNMIDALVIFTFSSMAKAKLREILWRKNNTTILFNVRTRRNIESSKQSVV